MPFDENLTLINGVAMTQTLDAVATSTSYPTSAPLTRARVIDLGAPSISGSPGGTRAHGLSFALVCTASATAGALVGYIQASASEASGYVTIGTFGDGSIENTEAPFTYVIRCQTELRYVRAYLTVDDGTWTNIWVVVGAHHLERL